MTTLVMDNDSTTIARLRATVDPDIKQKKLMLISIIQRKDLLAVWLNSALKNFKVRTHIERCFTYCVHQAEENSEKLAIDLRKIVHIYMVRKLSNLKNECIHT